MRAACYDRFGPPEVVHVEDLPAPTPGASEIRVRVGATAMTPPDAAARSGTPWFARLAFGPIRPRAHVLGGVCAGEVDAVGADVRGLGPGDRVVVATAAFGTHAQQTCVAAAGAVRTPRGVSDDDAVAVADGGLTALPFLRDHARLRAGQHVLVNGASGSVGLAAVQLAKMLGAEVTGVCSTANVDLVAKLGADHVIDYTREDPTDARGAYDVVFDAVGKGTFGGFRRALRPGGAYLTTVPSLRILGHTLVQPLVARRARRRGAIAFTGLRPAAAKAEDLAHLLRLAADGTLVTVVDRRYALDDVVAAHRYVDAGHKVGTVILATGD